MYHLLEGGNIWPESSEYEQTSEMVGALVKETEKYLKDLGLKIHVIGSSYNPTQRVYLGSDLVGYSKDGKFYKQDPMNADKYVQVPMPKGAKIVPRMTGDLDVQADLDQVSAHFNTKDPKATRQALDDFLKAKGLKTHKAGVTVHTLIPFKGKFYQVDIKAIPKAEKLAAAHRHDIPFGSPYKGVNKQMMLNSLASSQGYLWSPDEGLYARDPVTRKKAAFLTDDMAEVAEILLGVKDAAALGSVESMLAAIPDAKQREEIFNMAKQSASWQAATPTVGTNEWFRRSLELLK